MLRPWKGACLTLPRRIQPAILFVKRDLRQSVRSRSSAQGSVQWFFFNSFYITQAFLFNIGRSYCTKRDAKFSTRIIWALLLITMPAVVRVHQTCIMGTRIYHIANFSATVLIASPSPQDWGPPSFFDHFNKCEWLSSCKPKWCVLQHWGQLWHLI